MATSSAADPADVYLALRGQYGARTTADIDGVSTYPGPMSVPAGFSGAGAYDVIDGKKPD